MIPYFGDFTEDDTILIPFNTTSAPASAWGQTTGAASITITNLADADIKVHKDGSLTQIVTDGATVVIDFDGITGNHLITIDSSVHADYATGSEYTVRIEGATVDGATINAWVGSFSIERTGGSLALSKLIQAAVITNAAGVDVAADIIAMKADTTEIGTAGAGLTNLGGMSTTMKAQINVEVDGSMVTYKLDHLIASADGDDPVDGSIMAHLVSATEDWSTFVPSTDSLQAIRDRGDVSWISATSATVPTTLQATTIATLTSQTVFTLTAGSTDDKAYQGAMAIIEDSATATQKAVGYVASYTGSTKTITLTADPGIFTMAAGDTISIIANLEVISETGISRRK